MFKDLRHKQSLTLAAIATILVASLLGGCSQARRGDLVPLTAKQVELNVQSFDYVWKTIGDTYWDKDMGGVDWNAARSEYRQLVEHAATMADARDAMSKMVASLGKSHFAIIPQSAYDDIDVDDSQEGSDDDDQKGDSGIAVRIVDSQAIVTSVLPDSPAQRAGVMPGWIVVEIDDSDIHPMIDRIAEAFADSPRQQLMMSRAVLERLEGDAGDVVEVEFLDGRNKEVELSITLEVPRGTETSFGNLPPEYVWTEYKIIEDNIGYFYLNIWLDPLRVITSFNDAIKSAMDTEGFIIDLRGNPGGISGMAMGVAGWFIEDKQQYLGTMQTRDTQLKLVINPRLHTYSRPLAILIDGLSGSTSEFFAGGLQDLGRAKLFGSPTAAAALPSQIARLPNGDGFQYAIANYVSASGMELEGNGVHPDVQIELDREKLLKGHDQVLEAAVKWIRAQED